MTLTRTEPDFKKNERILWLAKNYGVLASVARTTGKSRAFVTDVFYGRRNSSDRIIETKLANVGAPGFKQYLRKRV